MSVLVKSIVGQFELEERHGLFHPVAAGSWRVRVQVGPVGRLGLGFASDLPLVLVPLQETKKIY